MGWAFGFFIFCCVAEGIYRGLQDRFGRNVIQGYREYKEECRRWERLMAADSRSNADTSLATDLKRFPSTD